MKKDRVIDERVSLQKQKIVCEAFSYVMMFLIGVILVKQFVFHAEFHEYAVEFIAFFGACFYVTVRNIIVGNHLFGENKGKLMLVNSVVTGIAITATMAFMRYREAHTLSGAAGELAVAFFSSAVAVCLVYFVLNKVTQKRIHTIEEKLDRDDS